MTDTPITEIIPIYTDDDGRIRVSNTRVLLDLIVVAYHRGETPEHIIQMYPSLTLDQVYLAIGYYLRHRDDVDVYLARMDAEAKTLREEWETTHPDRITRVELLNRLENKRDMGE